MRIYMDFPEGLGMSYSQENTVRKLYLHIHDLTEGYFGKFQLYNASGAILIKTIYLFLQ